MMSNSGIIYVLSFILIIVCVSSKEYTPEEKEAIEKLRKLAGDELYLDYLKEDYTLIKFLKARGLNVRDAHTMISETVKWRKSNKIDTINKEKILTDILQPQPLIKGHDKSGRPICYVSPAKWDTRRAVLANHRDEIVRVFSQFSERAILELAKARNSTGKDIRDVVVIMDLQGYNLRQHACASCFSVYLDWTRNYENYYPQTIGHYFMINTPRIFAPLLELLRGIFTEHTQKVLQVFSSQDEWMPVLSKLIDKNELLKQYGGTKV